jgi:phosphate transport system substrate-binding protein
LWPRGYESGVEKRFERHESSPEITTGAFMGISLVRRAALAAVFLMGPTALAAQDVVLSAKSGDLKVEGKLIEFDGEFFQVDTKFGPLMVDARTVSCAGDGCPTGEIGVARFAIASDGLLAVSLIEAFALYQGANVEQITGASGTNALTVRSESSGLLAEIAVLASDQVDPYAALSGGADAFVFAADPAPSGVRTQVIGLDAIIFATAVVNPVSTISVAQMRGVLSGEITNWKELGGGDTEINLHVADADLGFQAQIAALGFSPAENVKVQRHGRIKDLADIVAHDPFGLAIVPFSQLRTATAMGLRGTCGMHNRADEFTVQSGSYPMTYTISVAWAAKRLPLFAREFLEFLKTEQAQAVIADLGYVDLGISERGLDAQGQRLANSLLTIGKEVPLADLREMVGIISGADRLSATFRFLPGSTRLDAQSQENADALAAGLILGNYADKIVYLIGFSDGDGRARQNKTLSYQHADAVRAAVVKAAPEDSLNNVIFEVLGYGEASPLVCEDTPADQQINRRVEVWVKDRS